jgi:hypothetical protein
VHRSGSLTVTTSAPVLPVLERLSDGQWSTKDGIRTMIGVGHCTSLAFNTRTTKIENTVQMSRRNAISINPRLAFAVVKEEEGRCISDAQRAT